MKRFKLANMQQHINWVCMCVFIAVVCFTCGRCNGKQTANGKIFTDTVWRNIKDSSGEAYVPKLIAIQGGQIPDTIYQSVEIIRTDSHTDTIVISDTITNALIDYFAARHYKDTLKTRFGSIIISDIISQNAIQNRKWTSDLNIPEITKTVTTPSKKRNEVYLGMLLQGNTLSPLYATGPSILFKNKTDKTFEAAVLFNKQGVPMYQAGFHFKISFSGK
jgi:hypothetical protein